MVSPYNRDPVSDSKALFLQQVLRLCSFPPRICAQEIGGCKSILMNFYGSGNLWTSGRKIWEEDLGGIGGAGGGSYVLQILNFLCFVFGACVFPSSASEGPARSLKSP